jgi:hypothetical protein
MSTLQRHIIVLLLLHHDNLPPWRRQERGTSPALPVWQALHRGFQLLICTQYRHETIITGFHSVQMMSFCHRGMLRSSIVLHTQVLQQLLAAVSVLLFRLS